jgi:hypothetical protein
MNCVRFGCAWIFVLALAISGCASPVPDRSETRGPMSPDSIPDAYARPSGALIAAGATRGFLVDEHGDLYDGEWKVVFTPTADGQPATAPRTIAALDRWRPVLQWVRHAGDVTWEFEAVAVPERAPRDTVLVVSLLVRARNTGDAPHRAELSVTLAPPDPNPVFVAWDARDMPSIDLSAHVSPRVALRWASGTARDTALAWCGEAVAGATFKAATTLAPGAVFERRLLLPTYPTADHLLARHARFSHARRVSEALQAANAALAGGTSFALPDSEVVNAMNAARLLLLACRERRGNAWVPIGNPFQYRDVWLRDGARVAHALAITGYGPIARAMMAGFLGFQWPNGAFLSQRGQLDGTGQALWAFEQVMLRGARPEELDPYIEAGQRAWRWIEWQRTAGRTSGIREDGDGRVLRLPFGTMLPFADPRDAELVRAQLTGNDAWAIAGERALERMLRARGRTASADSVARDRVRYTDDFNAALARTGLDYVPPSWQGIGRDWGNLAIGWPCKVLAPGDRRLAATARRAWDQAGGLGLAVYGNRDSLHGYLGADLATWALLAGWRAPADSVLDAMLYWRTASGTAGELFTRSGDFGRNLPPHPTSAAGLIALVRNSLLYDDLDTLRLTLGARSTWWSGSRVNAAPTWWGPIDLEFHLAAGQATWRWTPVPVWTSLTLPPGTRLATPPSAPLVMKGDRVFAPPGTREASVQVSAVP